MSSVSNADRTGLLLTASSAPVTSPRKPPRTHTAPNSSENAYSARVTKVIILACSTIGWMCVASRNASRGSATAVIPTKRSA